MSKKILCGIAPILVLVVCAVAPSMASAAIKGEYGTCSKGTPVENPPCLAGEKFTAFPLNTPVKAVSRSTGTFTIENGTGTRGIKCGTASYTQTIENIEKEALQIVGTSKGQLTFGECKPINLAGCTEINPKTNHEITGEIWGDTVKKGKKVLISLGSGFGLTCVFGGSEINLGGFGGSFEGTASETLLEFLKAEGSLMGPLPLWEEATITGNLKTETEAGKEPVVVG